MLRQVCGSSEENSTSTSNFDTGVGVEELNKHLASLWSLSRTPNRSSNCSPICRKQYDKNSDGVLDAAEIQALITDAVVALHCRSQLTVVNRSNG